MARDGQVGDTQCYTAYTRGWASESTNGRVRLKAENDRLKEEVELLREEIRIKDARMGSIDALHRPHRPPAERAAILRLKAACGWSLEQTAENFLVTSATTASWIAQVRQQGEQSLCRPRGEPVNNFPQSMRQIVRQVRAVCSSLGKAKLSQVLARAGLHIGATTVGRILKGGGPPPGSETEPGPNPASGDGEQALRATPAERRDRRSPVAVPQVLQDRWMR